MAFAIYNIVYSTMTVSRHEDVKFHLSLGWLNCNKLLSLSLFCISSHRVMTVCYADARTIVRTLHGNSGVVGVGMGQGSGLSPLLFAIVMLCLGNCYMQIILWW